MVSGIDHFSLAVTDLDAAIDFFERAYGMRPVFREDGMTDQIQSMLGLSDGVACNIAQLTTDEHDIRLEVIEFRMQNDVSPPEELPVVPGMGHAGFWVENFDEHISRLRTLGAVPLGKVTQFEAGRSVYMKTQFGAVIEVSERHS